ncbi:hypothetical protein GP954_35270 [Escherichia coli]|uniref:Uncharacterized protein n=13 Tax=Escherichia coli TaxID=562 RepID=A0A6L7CP00_ECOLX|nr:hypothetical protein [Escherichia coli]
MLRKIARNCIKPAYTEGSLCWFRATPRNPKIKTVLQGDGSLCEPSPSTSLVGHFSVKVKPLTRSPMANLDPKNARPKGGSYFKIPLRAVGSFR